MALLAAHSLKWDHLLIGEDTIKHKKYAMKNTHMSSWASRRRDDIRLTFIWGCLARSRKTRVASPSSGDSRLYRGSTLWAYAEDRGCTASVPHRAKSETQSLLHCELEDGIRQLSQCCVPPDKAHDKSTPSLVGLRKSPDRGVLMSNGAA